MAKNLVNGTSTTIQENGDNISIQINFPIGYIYMSTSSTDPSTYFGGTWQRIAKGRTLVGVDENDTDFEEEKLTGGSKDLQSHNHTLQYSTNNGSTWSDATFGRNGSITGDAKYNGTNASVSTFSTYQTRVGYTGTGNSGNLQPYFTCYIWEKTAL